MTLANGSGARGGRRMIKSPPALSVSRAPPASRRALRTRRLSPGTTEFAIGRPREHVEIERAALGRAMPHGRSATRLARGPVNRFAVRLHPGPIARIERTLSFGTLPSPLGPMLSR